jgi:hypothetical protein
VAVLVALAVTSQPVRVAVDVVVVVHDCVVMVGFPVHKVETMQSLTVWVEHP